jgi:hypothetical protein
MIYILNDHTSNKQQTYGTTIISKHESQYTRLQDNFFQKTREFYILWEEVSDLVTFL